LWLRNSEEIWRELKDTYKEVADKTVLRKEKKNGPSWMSQDTLKVVENRRNMKMETRKEQKTKWRNTKKGLEGQGKLFKGKMQRAGREQ
jgi:hypothetical protein